MTPSPERVLDAAALRAARTFRFTPAENRDETVAVWTATAAVRPVR